MIKKILFLVFLYFLTRLIFLDKIPIFTDEAIYLRWSQILSGDLNYLYLPLTDGKPPLYMWIVGFGMFLFKSADPLIIGRLTSVILGISGLLGVIFTSWQLFKEKNISFLSGLLYVFSPFTFFYDRFAMADSFLAAIGLWALGLTIILIKTPKLLTSVLLGIVFGLGMLTKAPALFFGVLTPLCLILNKSKPIKKLFYLGFAFVIGRGIFYLLNFFPQAYVLSLKTYEFVIPLSEFLTTPFKYFCGNFKTLVFWEVSYLTIPVAMVSLFGLILGLKTKKWQVIILAGYFLSSFGFMCFFNKVIYPRFLLTFSPLILILAAFGLSYFSKPKQIILTMSVVSVGIFTIFQLYFTPNAAMIADNDSVHYLNSWSAGYGVKEINKFFVNKETIVGVEGTFGLMPYALELYQKDHPDLVVKPYWPPSDILPSNINYLIVYQRDKVPQNWPVELIMSFQQGNGKDFLKLYKIKI